MSFAGADQIEQSLEIAAAKGGDLNTSIYERLFNAYPETKPLFALDRDASVRGAMLAHVFETIFDFIGERRYAHRFIGAEIVTHDGYGVAPDAFAAFFTIVRDEVRVQCGAAWSDEMETAWTRLLTDLSAYTAAPN